MPTPLSEQSALGELDRAAGPAWLIDAAAARILAANAAGAGIFAVAGVLDAAMPAMARLRDIVSGIQGSGLARRVLKHYGKKGTREKKETPPPPPAPKILPVPAPEGGTSPLVSGP